MLTLHTNLQVGEATEKATTQLKGYQFNSYCTTPNGKMLAASADGLYEIGKDSDRLGDVDSEIQTFNLKLGHEGHKRVRYIYLGIETDGNLIITVFADDQEVWSKTVRPFKTGRQYMRITANSETCRGGYLRFKVENVGGCWFALDVMQAMPIALARGRFSR